MIQDWPADGLERVDSCPVCGNASRHQLYRGLVDRVFRCAPGRWDMYQCEECQSAYLDPRPTVATIHMAYQCYYTHETPPRQATDELPPWRRLVRALANGYRNHRYGGQLLPACKLGPWVLPLFPRQRQALDRELRFLPLLKPGARLLDVGFGSGEFMKLALRVGWKVSGVDPDPVAVGNALAAGLDVRQGDITAFEAEMGQFDVVTLSHVIEHVHEPVETIGHAYRLLKPGGLLYIDTPNIDAYGHREFRESWRGLEIPRHLVMFNWDSVAKLLIQSGFREVHNFYRFVPYAKLAQASRIIREDVHPRSPAWAKVLDVARELCLEYCPYSNNNMTEFITMYARK